MRSTWPYTYRSSMTSPRMKTLDPRHLAIHDAFIKRSRRDETPFARDPMGRLIITSDGVRQDCSPLLMKCYRFTQKSSVRGECDLSGNWTSQRCDVGRDGGGSALNGQAVGPGRRHSVRRWRAFARRSARHTLAPQGCPASPRSMSVARQSLRRESPAG